MSSREVTVTLHLLLVLLLVTVVVTASVLLVLSHLLFIALPVLDCHRLVRGLGLLIQSLPLRAGDLRNLRDLLPVALEVHADDRIAILFQVEEVPRHAPLRLVRVLLLFALLALLLRWSARL